jgi:hypothetical protein
MGAISNHNLGFITNNDTKMILDTSGNLGLGVTPSAWSSLYRTFQVGRSSFSNANSISTLVSHNYLFDGADKYIASDFASVLRLGGGTGGFQFFTAPSGTAGNAITFTQAMTLDASGNFYVGTTSQSGGSNITFNQPANADMKIAAAVSTGTRAAYQVFANNTVTTVGTENSTGGSLASGTSAYSTVLANNGAYPISFATNNTERARINSSGNLLVGTTSVSFGDSGRGNITVGGSSAAVYALQVGGTSKGFTYHDGTSLLLWNEANGPMLFGTNATERARIDSSGNLLVAKTSTLNSVAGIRLYGDSPGAADFTRDGGRTAQFNRLSSDGALVEFARQSNPVGTISVTGSATAYNTSSDYRLKENVQPMQDALAVIAQLNPVTYTWKADGSDGQGFIAHELQAVVPDCVSGEKDAVDAEGNPQYQGVDTSFLVATLVKAVQELKAEVDSLRAQLNP